MSHVRSAAAIFLTLLGTLAMSLAFVNPAAMADPHAVAPFDPAEIPWTRLRYEARKLFMKGTTEVRLAIRPTGELDARLIASPQGGDLKSWGPQTSLLELDSSFAGRESKVAVWFDPLRATALQRHKRRLGKKAYAKTYRFTGGGVFSHRRAPGEGEERLGEEKWSGLHETFYPHPELADCPLISEPSVIFYLASVAELAEPFEFCAFSDKVLSRVELRPAGTTTLAVDYVNGSQGRRQGRIEVQCIALEALPVAGQDEADFEFLGLGGDIELFLDGRLPVQVSGRISGVGKVDVRLVEAELK